ncbi:MAG: hypothetical protein H6726_22235 [Sandaracinaceae bacterium]|nr:hypothetical protein [Myxococcales bacterium]MCB9660379.1 hypothetical protein [Sandaracinaceae bacterium]
MRGWWFRRVGVAPSAPAARRPGSAWLAFVVALATPSLTSAQPTPYPETQPFVNASGSTPGRRPGQGLDLSVSLFGGVAFSGREEVALETPAVEASLAPAFVMGARLELSTSRYVAIGGFFDYTRMSVLILRDAPEEDFVTRTGLLGFGLFVKLRAPFELARHEASVYVSLPFGMGVLRPPAAAASDAAFGVVFGALAGLHLAVSDHLGVFVEAGLRASRFSDQSASFRQGAALAGAAYAF